jgi:hypothetical protein
LIQSVFEAAKVDVETTEALTWYLSFARRAAAVGPIASRLALMLARFANEGEALERVVQRVEHQRRLTDTLEGTLSLLGKTEILAHSAKDRQSAIEGELASVFEYARQAGLLTDYSGKPNEETDESGDQSG